MKTLLPKEERLSTASPPSVQNRCPACGAVLVEERCKLVCKSDKCVYRVVYTCNES